MRCLVLAEFFLKKIVKRQGLGGNSPSEMMRISDEALEKLCKQPWPGNIRELENTLARACALASSDVLLPDDIVLTESPRRPTSGTISSEGIQRIISQSPEDVNVLEWINSRIIEESLVIAKGDLQVAAEYLGISVNELKNGMKITE